MFASCFKKITKRKTEASMNVLHPPQKSLANDILDRVELFYIWGYSDEEAAVMFLSTGMGQEIISELYGKEVCNNAFAKFSQKKP